MNIIYEFLIAVFEGIMKEPLEYGMGRFLMIMPLLNTASAGLLAKGFTAVIIHVAAVAIDFGIKYVILVNAVKFIIPLFKKRRALAARGFTCAAFAAALVLLITFISSYEPFPLPAHKQTLEEDYTTKPSAFAESVYIREQEPLTASAPSQTVESDSAAPDTSGPDAETAAILEPPKTLEPPKELAPPKVLAP